MCTIDMCSAIEWVFQYGLVCMENRTGRYACDFFDFFAGPGRGGKGGGYRHVRYTYTHIIIYSCMHYLFFHG